MRNRFVGCPCKLKGIVAPEIGTKRFGTFEKQATVAKLNKVKGFNSFKKEASQITLLYETQ